MEKRPKSKGIPFKIGEKKYIYIYVLNIYLLAAMLYIHTTLHTYALQSIEKRGEVVLLRAEALTMCYEVLN